ncbi:MAG: type II toxin-antitoxin system RelB/DinJ family antitoxin [Clostridiales bacterium]|jgi:DNA-damage-inducible protein J|nr:type II toxin-antitoxin system RelB/DinJ family antitoxin [Clostridiales bacterium]
MQNTSLVQARIDSTLKQNAEALFADLGLDIPTAIRLFLTQCVKREGLPFEVARPHSASKSAPNDRLAQVLTGRPRVRLATNENGHAVVDKDKHPRLHDWAENG